GLHLHGDLFNRCGHGPLASPHLGQCGQRREHNLHHSGKRRECARFLTVLGADPNRHKDPDEYGHQHTHGDADRNTDTDVHEHVDADEHADEHADPDRDEHADEYANRDPDTDAHEHIDADE